MFPRAPAAALLLVLLAATAGCGNAVDVGPYAGLTGISVNNQGDFVVNAYVCGDKIDTIQIVRDRAGLKETEENPVVQTYRHDGPWTGLMTLNLSQPGADWTPDTPTSFEPSKGYLVTAQSSENETSQVYVAPGTLEPLVPGAIYTSTDDAATGLTAQTVAEFTAAAKAPCE